MSKYYLLRLGQDYAESRLSMQDHAGPFSHVILGLYIITGFNCKESSGR